MQAIETYLTQLISFFANNWIAAAILAVLIILWYIKKPKLLFQVAGLLVLAIGVLYIMIFLEKSMFSGVSSKERAFEVDRQAK